MRSRSRLAAALLAVAVGVAGCSDDGDAAAPGADAPAAQLADVDLAAAREATSAASTMRVTYTVAVGGLGGAARQRVELGGEGVFDVANARGRISTDLEGLLGPMVGGTLEQVFVDGVVYLHLPDGLARLLGSPTPWIRLDDDDLAGADLPEGLAALDQGDPTSALRWLEAAGDTRVVGSEDVGGVRTTHLAVTVDLERLPADDPADRAVRDRLLDEGVTTVPFDVWVDDDDLIRRVVVAVDQPGGEGTVRTTSEFSDFGTPVDVEAPPADQVTDARELTLPGAGAPGVTGTTAPARS